MFLEGAKLVSLHETVDGERQEYLAKGRTFTIGYYADCDLVVSDNRALGVHCIIECDPFDSVTIRNLCADHPILLNGFAVNIKRALFTNSTLNIFGKEYLWKFPKVSSSVFEGLENIESTTAFQPLPRIKRGQSCPDFKIFREIPKRLTIHHFAYCINPEDAFETNAIKAEVIASNDKLAGIDGADIVSEAQVSNTDSETNLNDEKIFNNPEKDTNNASSKTDLIIATNNKVNLSTEKNKKLLMSCQQSDVLITSYSPRVAGVNLEKSYTAVMKPTAPLIKITASTPKSIFATSIGGVSDINSYCSPSARQIQTPSSSVSMKSNIQSARKSSMYLIDFTTPTRLRPPSPCSSARGSTVKSNALLSKKLFSKDKHLQDNQTLLSTPVERNQCMESIISISSTDNSSVIELNSDSSECNSNPKMIPNAQLAKTPTSSHPSLMKKALLTSAKKRIDKTILDRGDSMSRSNPANISSCKKSNIISLAERNKHDKHTLLESGLGILNTSTPLASSSKRPLKMHKNAINSKRSPLHQIRKSASNLSKMPCITKHKTQNLQSHASTSKLSAIKAKSPQAMLRMRLLAKSRKTCSAITSLASKSLQPGPSDKSTKQSMQSKQSKQLTDLSAGCSKSTTSTISKPMQIAADVFSGTFIIESDKDEDNKHIKNKHEKENVTEAFSNKEEGVKLSSQRKDACQDLSDESPVLNTTFSLDDHSVGSVGGNMRVDETSIAELAEINPTVQTDEKINNVITTEKNNYKTGGEQANLSKDIEVTSQITADEQNATTSDNLSAAEQPASQQQQSKLNQNALEVENLDIVCNKINELKDNLEQVTNDKIITQSPSIEEANYVKHEAFVDANTDTSANSESSGTDLQLTSVSQQQQSNKNELEAKELDIGCHKIDQLEDIVEQVSNDEICDTNKNNQIDEITQSSSIKEINYAKHEAFVDVNGAKAANTESVDIDLQLTSPSETTKTNDDVVSCDGSEDTFKLLEEIDDVLNKSDEIKQKQSVVCATDIAPQTSSEASIQSLLIEQQIAESIRGIEHDINIFNNTVGEEGGSPPVEFSCNQNTNKVTGELTSKNFNNENSQLAESHLETVPIDIITINNTTLPPAPTDIKVNNQPAMPTAETYPAAKLSEAPKLIDELLSVEHVKKTDEELTTNKVNRKSFDIFEADNSPLTSNLPQNSASSEQQESTNETAAQLGGITNHPGVLNPSSNGEMKAIESTTDDLKKTLRRSARLKSMDSLNNCTPPTRRLTRRTSLSCINEKMSTTKSNIKTREASPGPSTDSITEKLKNTPLSNIQRCQSLSKHNLIPSDIREAMNTITEENVESLIAENLLNMDLNIRKSTELNTENNQQSTCNQQKDEFTMEISKNVSQTSTNNDAETVSPLVIEKQEAKENVFEKKASENQNSSSPLQESKIIHEKPLFEKEEPNTLKDNYVDVLTCIPESTPSISYHEDETLHKDVKQTMKNSNEKSATPISDSVKELAVTPENRHTYETTLSPKSTPPNVKNTEEIGSFDKYLKTPRAGNIMMQAFPYNDVNEISQKTSENLISSGVCELNSGCQSTQLGDMLKPITSNPKDLLVTFHEQESEIGEEIVQNKSTKVYDANVVDDIQEEEMKLKSEHQLSSPNFLLNETEAESLACTSTDVIADMPKSEIEEWVETLNIGKETGIFNENKDVLLSASGAAYSADFASSTKMHVSVHKADEELSSIISSENQKSSNKGNYVSIDESGLNLLEQTMESAWEEPLLVSDNDDDYAKDALKTSAPLVSSLKVSSDTVIEVSISDSDNNSSEDIIEIMQEDNAPQKGSIDSELIELKPKEISIDLTKNSEDVDENYKENDKNSMQENKENKVNVSSLDNQKQMKNKEVEMCSTKIVNTSKEEEVWKIKGNEQLLQINDQQITVMDQADAENNIDENKESKAENISQNNFDNCDDIYGDLGNVINIVDTTDALQQSGKDIQAGTLNNSNALVEFTTENLYAEVSVDTAATKQSNVDSSEMAVNTLIQETKSSKQTELNNKDSTAKICEQEIVIENQSSSKFIEQSDKVSLQEKSDEPNIVQDNQASSSSECKFINKLEALFGSISSSSDDEENENTRPIDDGQQSLNMHACNTSMPLIDTISVIDKNYQQENIDSFSMPLLANEGDSCRKSVESEAGAIESKKKKRNQNNVTVESHPNTLTGLYQELCDDKICDDDTFKEKNVHKSNENNNIIRNTQHCEKVSNESEIEIEHVTEAQGIENNTEDNTYTLFNQSNINSDQECSTQAQSQSQAPCEHNQSLQTSNTSNIEEHFKSQTIVEQTQTEVKDIILDDVAIVNENSAKKVAQTSDILETLTPIEIIDNAEIIQHSLNSTEVANEEKFSKANTDEIIESDKAQNEIIDDTEKMEELSSVANLSNKNNMVSVNAKQIPSECDHTLVKAMPDETIDKASSTTEQIIKPTYMSDVSIVDDSNVIGSVTSEISNTITKDASVVVPVKFSSKIKDEPECMSVEYNRDETEPVIQEKIPSDVLNMKKMTTSEQLETEMEKEKKDPIGNLNYTISAKECLNIAPEVSNSVNESVSVNLSSEVKDELECLFTAHDCDEAKPENLEESSSDMPNMKKITTPEQHKTKIEEEKRDPIVTRDDSVSAKVCLDIAPEISNSIKKNDANAAVSVKLSSEVEDEPDCVFLEHDCDEAKPAIQEKIPSDVLNMKKITTAMQRKTDVDKEKKDPIAILDAINAEECLNIAHEISSSIKKNDANAGVSVSISSQVADEPVSVFAAHDCDKAEPEYLEESSSDIFSMKKIITPEQLKTKVEKEKKDPIATLDDGISAKECLIIAPEISDSIKKKDAKAAVPVKFSSQVTDEPECVYAAHDCDEAKPENLEESSSDILSLKKIIVSEQLKAEVEKEKEDPSATLDDAISTRDCLKSKQINLLEEASEKQVNTMNVNSIAQKFKKIQENKFEQEIQMTSNFNLIKNEHMLTISENGPKDLVCQNLSNIVAIEQVTIMGQISSCANIAGNEQALPGTNYKTATNKEEMQTDIASQPCNSIKNEDIFQMQSKEMQNSTNNTKDALGNKLNYSSETEFLENKASMSTEQLSKGLIEGSNILKTCDSDDKITSPKPSIVKTDHPNKENNIEISNLPITPITSLGVIVNESVASNEDSVLATPKSVGATKRGRKRKQATDNLPKANIKKIEYSPMRTRRKVLASQSVQSSAVDNEVKESKITLKSTRERRKVEKTTSPSVDIKKQEVVGLEAASKILDNDPVQVSTMKVLKANTSCKSDNNQEQAMEVHLKTEEIELNTDNPSTVPSNNDNNESVQKRLPRTRGGKAAAIKKLKDSDNTTDNSLVEKQTVKLAKGSKKSTSVANKQTDGKVVLVDEINTGQELNICLPSISNASVAEDKSILEEQIKQQSKEVEKLTKIKRLRITNTLVESKQEVLSEKEEELTEYAENDQPRKRRNVRRNKNSDAVQSNITESFNLENSHICLAEDNKKTVITRAKLRQRKATSPTNQISNDTLKIDGENIELKPEIHLKSLEDNLKTTVSVSSVSNPISAEMSTVTGVYTTARGRTCKPTAKIEQLLEKERSGVSSFSPSKRIYARKCIPTEYTKVETIQTENDSVTQRGESRQLAAEIAETVETKESSPHKSMSPGPAPSSAVKGRRGARKLKIPFDTDESEASTSKKTDAECNENQNKASIPTRLVSKRNAAAAAKVRIEEDALAATTVYPPKRTRAKRTVQKNLDHNPDIASSYPKDNNMENDSNGDIDNDDNEDGKIGRYTTTALERNNETKNEKTDARRKTRKIISEQVEESSVPIKRSRKENTIDSSNQQASTSQKMKTKSDRTGRSRKNVHFDVENENVHTTANLSTLHGESSTVTIEASSPFPLASEAPVSTKRTTRVRRK